MSSRPPAIVCLVRQIVQVTGEIDRQVTWDGRNSSRICTLANELVGYGQRLYHMVSTHRRSFESLPSVLFMMVATMNATPSLRTLGLTSKAMYAIAHEHTHAVNWTHAIYDLTTPALLEFAWLNRPRHLSKYHKRIAECLVFNSKEAIEYSSRSLHHHPIDGIDDWSRGILYEMPEDVLSIHLTRDTLYILADCSERTICNRRLIRMSRLANGSFDAENRTHLDFTQEGYRLDKATRFIYASAWSPDSFFTLTLSRDGEKVFTEYDINDCTLKRQFTLALVALATEKMDDDNVYMAWFEGMLLLGMTYWDGENKAELSLIHWATSRHTELPTTEPADLGSVLATLQIHGSPLVYLSFEQNINRHEAKGHILVLGPEFVHRDLGTRTPKRRRE
jgi:hypothetical protein